MRNRFVLFLLIFVDLVSASLAQPATIPSTFEKRSPGRYEAVSTVVMQYRWFKIPLLGVISVDANRRKFALAGMSQLGLKVFEVREDAGNVQSQLPQVLLKRNPKLGSAIAGDVRRMFLDLTPAPNATTRNAGPLVMYAQPAEDGILEYNFDRVTGNLVEKRFSKKSGILPWNTTPWLVTYTSYAKSGSKHYPRTVSFKNRSLHYRITVIVKEMRPL